MDSKLSSASKVGFFALLAIVLIVYLTFRASDFKFSSAETYSLYLNMQSAEEVDQKTPVLIAGIQIGIVEKVELTENSRARVKLKIRKEVQLPRDVQAELRAKGILGDVFLELIPGNSPDKLASGDTIERIKPYTDFNELARNLNDVAVNLKEVSNSIKQQVGSESSSFSKIMKNMEKLTENLAGFAGSNRQNMDQVVLNLRDLTRDLKGMVHENSDEVNETLRRLASITEKIDHGKGTVGKLINDPSTGDKINETLDSVNDIVTPISKLQIELGYHLEYLSRSGDIKNYVSLALKPRNDKYFLLEFVSDPNPAPVRTTTTSRVTAGGFTSTITTQEEEVSHNKLRISAELAKKFYDFTFRAGVIESSGGVGIDYNKGPFGVQFSAFDFANGSRDRPHLKAMATFNLTKGFYVLGGADDFISKQRGPDWFIGAGLRFLDEDVKSFLGAFSLRP